MITGELKNKIDKIWEIFWTGGITNPLDVIEQFTYLLFIKQLDDVETTKENEANFLGFEYESMFPGDCQKYRWSKFKNLGSADEMYDLVLNGVFPFIKNLHQDGESAYSKYMGDAIFKIPTLMELTISELVTKKIPTLTQREIYMSIFCQKLQRQELTDSLELRVI